MRVLVEREVMNAPDASRTAIAVAALRYYHHVHAEPKDFDDPLAGLLLSDAEKREHDERSIRNAVALQPELASWPAEALVNYWHFRLSPYPGNILGRARYNEDLLAGAVAQGVSQYVILGAGLDTFAWRRPDLCSTLTVFEVDTPNSQQFKRERLALAGLAEPDYLHFLPADFERHSIADVLSQSAFEPTQPSFFSWLGVIHYLSPRAVDDAFKSIRSVAAPGSEIVFTYIDEALFQPENQSPIVRRAFEGVAALGEPYLSGLDPANLGEKLHDLGFSLIEDLGQPEQVERYFKDRKDGLRPIFPQHFSHARAV
jgi:methyltransferase (TIGR00027 family)